MCRCPLVAQAEACGTACEAGLCESVTQLAIVLLLTALAWVVWRTRRGSAVFVIQIRDGRASALQGAVTNEFLAIVEELAAQHHLDAGEIRGQARGPRIRLSFSRDIPDDLRQQLRNWWVAAGWPPPRSRG